MSTSLPLTPEEKRTLFGTAQTVWNEIGYDLLQCVAEAENLSVNAVTIPADEVVEVVCDAGRLREALRRRNALTPNLTAWLDSYPQLERLLVRECFTCSRYGM